MITAIIVAAGQGVRMGSTHRKQYLELSGRPIVFRTLITFDACEAVDRILLVVPADDREYCRRHFIDGGDLTTQTILVDGGRRRQESVYNGIRQIDEKEGIVLVHDGVRPLVTAKIIEACIQGAVKWGACIPAVPPVDTPKQVSGDGVITQTLLRDTVRLAQTPQAFQLPIIRKAHQAARQKRLQVTDDASLVELMGVDVHVIPGQRENLKITTPEDLAIAEVYLSRREGQVPKRLKSIL